MGALALNDPLFNNARNSLYPRRRTLFEYRIRKIGQNWFVLTEAEEIECSSYMLACIVAEQLKTKGYVDGDR